jgi:hypothetical protein
MARPADWPAAVYDVPLAQAMHDIGAGRRQWPSNPEKKRHHFVPRFILDAYATSEGATTRRLVQLDKTTGRALKVLREKAASRRRFYAVESDESPRDNRIEDFLSLVEGYAADPIRTLLERHMELTEADRITIALMLALQERRTPFGIAEAGKAVEKFGREQMATLARDPRAFAEMWSKSAPDRSSPADIEAARLEVRPDRRRAHCSRRGRERAGRAGSSGRAGGGERSAFSLCRGARPARCQWARAQDQARR